MGELSCGENQQLSVEHYAKVIQTEISNTFRQKISILNNTHTVTTTHNKYRIGAR